ncbi:flagellar hook assembly protein FlgD [Hyphomonas sp.]|uniref:flagellar hook assembly protein FlgD n=1 Tax=Hyphomonas sp. TaxID=87 RepID=UPI00391B8009
MTTVSPMVPTTTNYSTAAASSGMGQEFNSFIKLLTAQVRNQDPLSPMDSTQFVEQLATFSTLEQQVKANASLTSIAGMLSQLNALTAGEWLGQDISFVSGWAPLADDPVEFTYAAPDGTNSIKLTVLDANGEVVWTETLDPSKAKYAWNGRSNDGTSTPRGAMYEFVIESYSGDELLATGSPRVLSTVTDIISEDGRIRVGTAAGMTVDLAKVRKV